MYTTSETLDASERSLALRVKRFGACSTVAQASYREVILLRNSIAMARLGRDDYRGAIEMLRVAGVRAESQSDPSLFTLTANNWACCARRRGKMRDAVSVLQRALRVAVGVDGFRDTVDGLAQTNLNLCATLSQLERHATAATFAWCAVFHCQHNLAVCSFARRVATAATSAELIREEREKAQTLAISYHNLAAELDHCRSAEAKARAAQQARRPGKRITTRSGPEAMRWYRRAFRVARAHLAQSNPRLVAQLHEMCGGTSAKAASLSLSSSASSASSRRPSSSAAAGRRYNNGRRQNWRASSRASTSSASSAVGVIGLRRHARRRKAAASGHNRSDAALRAWLRHIGLESYHARFVHLGLKFGDLSALRAQVERGDADASVLGKMLGVPSRAEAPSPEDEDDETEGTGNNARQQRSATEKLAYGLRELDRYTPVPRSPVRSAMRPGHKPTLAETTALQPQPQPQPTAEQRPGWSATRLRVHRAALRGAAATYGMYCTRRETQRQRVAAALRLQSVERRNAAQRDAAQRRDAARLDRAAVAIQRAVKQRAVQKQKRAKLTRVRRKRQARARQAASDAREREAMVKLTTERANAAEEVARLTKQQQVERRKLERLQRAQKKVMVAAQAQEEAAAAKAATAAAAAAAVEVAAAEEAAEPTGDVVMSEAHAKELLKAQLAILEQRLVTSVPDSSSSSVAEPSVSAVSAAEEAAPSAPSGGVWSKHLDDASGAHYYYNETTEESCWELPPTRKVPSERERGVEGGVDTVVVDTEIVVVEHGTEEIERIVCNVWRFDAGAWKECSHGDVSIVGTEVIAYDRHKGGTSQHIHTIDATHPRPLEHSAVSKYAWVLRSHTSDAIALQFESRLSAAAFASLYQEVEEKSSS